MRWDRDYQSDFVEDRRGMSTGGGGGGLLFLLFLLFRRFGIAGVLIGGALVGALYLFGGTGGEGPQRFAPGEAQQGVATSDEMKSFVSFVLDDVQGTWNDQFQERGLQYDPARLVLFTDRVQSACGLSSSATGPFYCPRDQRVYIDLSFYRQLRERLGAPGDFAQAYVIAHEIGHHIQALQGTLAGGPRGQGAQSESVRVELQADCYAGVWAHSAQQRDLLEVGDVQEALDAAAAIGDDRLQKAATGTVQPESWTHGSSEQRMRWFMRGMQSGDPSACDTFEAATL